ncbi:MAG: DNA-binding protein [Candidatus Bathyarchaeota archaeon]|nr:DNA-binding protein [Candidatus Bathyarchaeota archaeon]
MDYTEAKLGRIFVLRLYDKEVLHETIEKFATQNKIRHALCFFLGGAKEGSKLVVGPKNADAPPHNPILTLLLGVHETYGVGTLIQDEQGIPKLHMHASFGRENHAVTGCVRAGVNVWLIGEVVILELADISAQRIKDPKTGFELLQVKP